MGKKGPMNGIGGIIKNKASLDVKSGIVHVNDATSFAEYADLATGNIKSLYILVNHVFEDPRDIDSAPKIPFTLTVH